VTRINATINPTDTRPFLPLRASPCVSCARRMLRAFFGVHRVNCVNYVRWVLDRDVRIPKFYDSRQSGSATGEKYWILRQSASALNLVRKIRIGHYAYGRSQYLKLTALMHFAKQDSNSMCFPKSVSSNITNTLGTEQDPRQSAFAKKSCGSSSAG